MERDLPDPSPHDQVPNERVGDGEQTVGDIIQNETVTGRQTHMNEVPSRLFVKGLLFRRTRKGTVGTAEVVREDRRSLNIRNKHRGTLWEIIWDRLVRTEFNVRHQNLGAFRGVQTVIFTIFTIFTIVTRSLPLSIVPLLSLLENGIDERLQDAELPLDSVLKPGELSTQSTNLLTHRLGAKFKWGRYARAPQMLMARDFRGSYHLHRIRRGDFHVGVPPSLCARFSTKTWLKSTPPQNH